MRGGGTSVNFHPISNNVSMPKQNCSQNHHFHYQVSIWDSNIKYDTSLSLQLRDKVTDHSFNILLKIPCIKWKQWVYSMEKGEEVWLHPKPGVCVGGDGVFLKVFEEEEGDSIAWASHTCMKTVYITFVFGKLFIPLWSLGLHSLIFTCMINIKSSTWLC